MNKVFVVVEILAQPYPIMELSKPKLNQQLISTEFEVRLHSYSEIHHKLPLLLLLLTAQLAGRDLCVQMYSHFELQSTSHMFLTFNINIASQK